MNESCCRYIGCLSRHWFCLSSERGSVNLWKIPQSLRNDNEDEEPRRIKKSKIIRKKINLVDVSNKYGRNYDNEEESIEPYCKGLFSIGWENKQKDLLNFSEEISQAKSDITASCVSLEKMILVRGYSDGSITIQKIPFSKETPRAHRGHRGKVTSLMHVTSYSEGENRMILSGGEDLSNSFMGS